MWLLIFLFAFVAAQAQNGATSTDWPYHGGTLFAWRYSALDQINTSNVQKLAPAWMFQTGDYENGLQATPIVVDGVLYLGTPRDQPSRWMPQRANCSGNTNIRSRPVAKARA
jgi:glucose dehydrogenase